MKKWTGGSVILALALLLFLRYALLPSSSSAATAAAAASPRRQPRRSRPPPHPSLSPKPHLLLSLPGLDVLFPSPNSTRSPQLDPSSKLAWAHMRPLLLRSDALPATADGVREAAAAWTELLAALDAEIGGKAAPFGGSNAELEKKSCPFAVNGSGSSLDIPCGFVQDSAVTVVGIPTGRNGSSRFGIELVGSRLPDGEAEPPMVLRCNVSLGGDGPLVAQNSWTVEGGWGEWEQCPAIGSAAANSSLKVDELVRCNEQLGESGVLENLNGSRPDGEKPAEKLKHSSHLSVGSPFVEGHPFTATLWAGLEGFHLTVNGRHETSFAYRERLEPWSVSEVRISGDLQLLSSLANGLPVSVDLDLIGDVKVLQAPPVPKRRIFMLVGVSSAANNFERRMALRRSWMQYEAVRSGNVAVRFLTGLHKNKQVNLELWREAQTYGDIQLMPFVDYYSLITLKTIALCILGTKILPAKYIMKTDDDAFVRINEILSSLNKSVSNGLLYGLISFESSPHRDKDSKWFISQEEWPHDKYPPWAHGPGYIISRDIAKFIARGHQERNLQVSYSN
uniref:Hydroxyproline O-galactosyltransferase GALT3 isoform X3 n=1 Tax=Elaeis guineensis var. tenera TaxID=51953 RepID=A0A8N4F416_ELAGV|nr:hydroxyproline O-galactosyltransferase GALT3 isoform X3 [Elaeis guineensis]